MVTLALVAGMYCTADADTWSLFALIVADGDLQGAGEEYARRLVTAGKDNGWSVALQLDNAGESPVRRLIANGREVPAGDGQVARNSAAVLSLVEFFRWAREKAPAEHYAVAVFGHGVGASGRGWDGMPVGRWPMVAMDASAGGDALQPSELATAVQEGVGSQLDILMLDCCYGGSLEVAWDLRAAARIIIASPGRVLSRGVPWATMLSGGADGAGAEDLAGRWTRARDGLVAVRTDRLVAVGESVRGLSSTLLTHIEQAVPDLSRARSESRTFGAEGEMCGLYSLCDSLAGRQGTAAEVVAGDVMVALEACVLEGECALTVPFPPGLEGRMAQAGPEGFNRETGWGLVTSAYRDRLQDLMRRTLDNRRDDGAAT